MNRLVILGAGGFARETLDIVDAINAHTPTWEMLGFIVDSQYGLVGEIINDRPILGDFTWLEQHRDVYVICGVGAPETRRHMIARLTTLNPRYASLIHPSTIRTRWMNVGQGVVVAAGSVLSNTIALNHHVHINPNCTIGHDVTIGSFTSIAPGAIISGNVEIGEGAYFGTGAKIIEKKRVGSWSTIGAGAAVISDVPDNATVVGVPARVIKQREAGWQLEQT